MYCGGVNTGRVACGAKPASISRALAVAKFGGMRLRGTLRCRSRSQLAVRRWEAGAGIGDGRERVKSRNAGSRPEQGTRSAFQGRNPLL